MRLNLVLHDEEVAPKRLPVERPILAEAHMERRLRPRHVVLDVFDFSYGCVSAVDISMTDGTKLILMVTACLGGLRTETWGGGMLCAPARDSA